MQIKAKEVYGGNRVKTYTDLGHACYGKLGKRIVAFTMIIQQLLICIGYITFFYEQMDQVMY